MRDLRNAIGETNSLPILGAPLMGGVCLPTFYRYCSAYPNTGEWSHDPWEDWEDPANAEESPAVEFVPTLGVLYDPAVGFLNAYTNLPQFLTAYGPHVVIPIDPETKVSLLEPDHIAEYLEWVAEYIRGGGLLPSLNVESEVC